MFFRKCHIHVSVAYTNVTGLMDSPLLGSYNEASRSPLKVVVRVSSQDSRGGRTHSNDPWYVYPMGVVERLTNLTRRRIRYYEKCGLLQPSRTQGGQRLYSPENLDTLNRIKGIIDSGITTMEAVKRMLSSGLDRTLRTERPGGPARRAVGERDRLWMPRPDSMGDAAVRVMRPVPAPVTHPDKTSETDSPSYFRRVNVVAEPLRKPGGK